MPTDRHGLTKFERVRVLRDRAEQLRSNEFPLVTVPPDVYDLTKIAELELEAGVLVDLVGAPRQNQAWHLVRDLNDGHR